MNRMTGCRGMTLVETLVVVAVGTVLLGLILGAFIETNRATNSTIARQQALQEALTKGQAIERMIRFRVRSEDLGAASETTTGSVVEKMAGNELRLASLARGAQDGTLYWGAGNYGEGKESRVWVSGSAKPGDAQAGQPAPGQIPTTVGFQYGRSENDGATVWTDEGGADTQLVRLRVSAMPAGTDGKPAIYETVVPLP
jgi:prepilin-type N-terminal cleavage/methylation domain-containing protein